MDEEYDVVVCGTGLKECILSGLLSVHGKKVLHIDRNPYYGGESASLNLTNLYQKFRPGTAPPSTYGANRDWNVDLIPKFVMACGQLVKILLRTKVNKYLEWQVVEGTYVYQYQKGGMFGGGPKYIHKVPASDMEALTSPLMGLLEKNRCRGFFSFVAHFDHKNKETWKGFDPKKTTMRKVYEYFGLHPNTIDFVGHAVSLYTTDGYLDRPMGVTMDRIQLYMYSVSRYGSSPFIYPVYGLGGLPEGFSRLSAIHGGTYMLNTGVEEFVFDGEGKVCGVKGTEGVAKCKMVVCDPSYVSTMGKTKKEGQVIRCICILGHTVADTDDKTSCQIILPQMQLKRKHDIYIAVVSATHGVSMKGKYIALVSTTVETDNPMQEIEPALKLLSPVEEKFVEVSDIYVPTDNGAKDQIFVTESYDATSHFESATEDVLKIWKNITGSDLDLTVTPEAEEE